LSDKQIFRGFGIVQGVGEVDKCFDFTGIDNGSPPYSIHYNLFILVKSGVGVEGMHQAFLGNNSK
jgi:hypothetical protein